MLTVTCCRWCDEDPTEILSSVYTCIEKAVENLVKLNINPSSIKGLFSVCL